MLTPEQIAAEAAAKKDADDRAASAKELETLKAKNLEYENKIKELTKKPGDGKDDLDLEAKAKAQREAEEKKAGDTKALERALTFNLKSADFLKTNESLLPKDVPEIFKLAEKENYANAIEKDGAIKAGLIQSFFAVQANMDLLTPGLKSSLDEYLSLTKNEKQSRAQGIYESIFEPAFEMLKRIKKAEALSLAKSKGYSTEGDDEMAYKNKLTKLSRQHYLGEKT